LRIRRTTLGSLFLGDLPTLIFYLTAVEAHGWIVAARPVKSRLRLCSCISRTTTHCGYAELLRRTFS
jgi:hypothetical protein